uniref:Uncharacterized protein n=1 Tax=Parascaris equorum TaxID=6256 RepID=A0A914RWU9_PAREQ
MSLTGTFTPDDRRLKSPQAIFNELHRTPRNIRAAYASVMASVNVVSTDATGGFQCFMKKAIVDYLSQAHVRDAIHIPNYVPAYQRCRRQLDMEELARAGRKSAPAERHAQCSGTADLRE